MDTIKVLTASARSICIVVAILSLGVFPVIQEASKITVTIYLLTWIMSALECFVSMAFLLALLTENPMPRHLWVCFLLILLDWVVALQTVGTGSAALLLTKTAVSYSKPVDNYKGTMNYAILVLTAGVVGLIAAFFNVIFAQNLRHPPPGNH